MNPRIIVLLGGVAVQTVSLELAAQETFTVGRAAECDLQIENAGISRRHFHISRRENDFLLEDLDSHNGTRVNNLPVQSRLLTHGDRVTVGKSSFIFLTEESDDEPSAQAVLDDGGLAPKTSTIINPYTDTVEFPSDLGILVRLGQAINHSANRETLQRSFLEIILEFIPARRAAILLTDENLNVIESISLPVVNHSPPMQISRTVCRQVLTREVALLSNDLTGSNLDLVESLAISSVSSLLCVPLKIGTTRGVLYFDAGDPSFQFTRSHLEQLTALSFIIAAVLTNFASIENLQQENALLREDLKIETSIIGESQPILQVFYLISKVAPAEATVLISGESGTGKELAAKALHQNSHRSKKPFAAINCAVLNENLLESELFGHEKGAFTGAVLQKKGKFEMAEGGTIFLDEIGELAPSLQAKLLRVLQEQEFERVGGGRTIKSNVRVIAATNRDLTEEIKKGTFRQDLYFRLNVVNLKMPSLRERKSDIPLLARHFIIKYGEKCGRKISGLSEQARKILTAYDWPGNVRELENVIERAVIFCAGELILPGDLPGEMIEAAPGEKLPEGDFHEQVRQAKKNIVGEALALSGGSFTEASRRLGILPNNLHRLIRQLGLKEEKPV